MTDQTTTEADAPACHMPGHPGPAGHVNACQLCPGSPTYWRGPEAKDSAAPPQPCRWTAPPKDSGTS